MLEAGRMTETKIEEGRKSIVYSGYSGNRASSSQPVARPQAPAAREHERRLLRWEYQLEALYRVCKAVVRPAVVTRLAQGKFVVEFPEVSLAATCK
jgi:hypothetical protein